MYTPIYTSVEWTIVRDYNSFVETIEKLGLPEIISFDHDLADEFKEKTGYDCAKWLVNYCMDNHKELPNVILVHSMNPVGKKNIQSYIESYKRSSK